MSDAPDIPETDANPADAQGDAPVQQPMVEWDDSKMTSSFANVVNVLATREELTLLFGANQTWNTTNTNKLVVQLSERIVLSPHAAKRLSLLLARRVAEYEDRFGKLDF